MRKGTHAEICEKKLGFRSEAGDDSRGGGNREECGERERERGAHSGAFLFEVGMSCIGCQCTHSHTHKHSRTNTELGTKATEDEYGYKRK